MKVFKEEQRFTQSWLIVILVITIVITIGIVLNEFLKENTTMSSMEFWIIVLSLPLFTLPIFFIKLITKIDENGIYYQFFPFHLSEKHIRWSEIQTANVRQYNPIQEYGGWGLKSGFRRKHGKAVNISGDIGIQLQLKNSKKILIGTQKKGEALKVLDTYKNKLS